MVVAGVRREGGRRWLVVLQTWNRVSTGLVYLLSCLRGIVYYAANLSSQRRFANLETDLRSTSNQGFSKADRYSE